MWVKMRPKRPWGSILFSFAGRTDEWTLSTSIWLRTQLWTGAICGRTFWLASLAAHTCRAAERLGLRNWNGWEMAYRIYESLRPWEQGFDSYFGFLGGAHTYIPGRRDADSLVRNGQQVNEKKYLTDAFGREASEFIDRSKDQPFFIYVAFNAAH